MSEQEMTLSKLGKEFQKYEKKLKSCVEILGKDLNESEREKLLGRARFEFDFYLGFNRSHTVQSTPDEALWHAICSITKDKNQAQRILSACCLSRILLKKLLLPCLKLLKIAA